MTVGMGGHSPSNILHHLKGIGFPADKSQLVRHAEAHQADRDILEVLNKMPDEKYNTMADVLKAIGQVE